MRTNSSIRTRLLAMAFALSAASAAALGQTETAPPAQLAELAADLLTGGEAAQGETGAADAEAGEAAESSMSMTISSAGAYNIARWVRAIGGRVCLGPKIDSRTVVSKPRLRASRTWRVSVPTFASARVSAPPKRATLASQNAEDSAQADEQQADAGNGTEQVVADAQD